MILSDCIHCFPHPLESSEEQCSSLGTTFRGGGQARGCCWPVPLTLPAVHPIATPRFIFINGNLIDNQPGGNILFLCLPCGKGLPHDTVPRYETEMATSRGLLRKFRLLDFSCPFSLKFPSTSFSLEHRCGAMKPKVTCYKWWSSGLAGIWASGDFLKPQHPLGPDLLWMSRYAKENKLHLNYYHCS